MSYQVKYTETTNPSKPPITVEDQTVNSQTDLKFVGKNYAGYASYMAENFLHLLENFAKNTAPTQPVEGQLWYDNSPDVNLLKVYDGTVWTAAGSVKKFPTAPSVGIIGDLWVNTDTQQLHVYSGSNWLLIGPQYSSGSKTGPDVETIVDSNNISHSVISFWANNSKVAILSKESFKPKLFIPGFATIGQGFNISTVDADSLTSPTKMWGTASQADALVVSGSAIAASNFLRGDVISTSNTPLNIRASGGLSIGSDLSFNIGQELSSTILYSKTSGGTIDLKLTATNGTVNTVLRVDSNSRVGVNTISPQEALDVTGNIKTSGSVIAAGLLTGNSLTVVQDSIFNGFISTLGQIQTSYLDVDGNPFTIPVIIPGPNDSADAIYDIGSSTRRFRNM